MSGIIFRKDWISNRELEGPGAVQSIRLALITIRNGFDPRATYWMIIQQLTVLVFQQGAVIIVELLRSI